MFVVSGKCYPLSILPIHLYPDCYFQFLGLVEDQIRQLVGPLAHGQCMSRRAGCRDKPSFFNVKFALITLFPDTYSNLSTLVCVVWAYSATLKPETLIKLKNSNTTDSAEWGRDSLASLAKAMYISLVIGLHRLAIVSSRSHA